MYNKEQLEKALLFLGKRLEIDGASPLNLFVCGGAALIIGELISRHTTKDVDVVAVGYSGTDGKLEIKSSKPLPEILKKAAQQVARDLGMDESWLNPDPADLMKFGLPDSFMQRVETRVYSKVLTVCFLGRYDQIHLKVYAAVDQGPGKHLNDLLELKPTKEEMESAARWAMQHDTSEGFKIVLKDMLQKIGYESVANRV